MLRGVFGWKCWRISSDVTIVNGVATQIAGGNATEQDFGIKMATKMGSRELTRIVYHWYLNNIDESLTQNTLEFITQMCPLENKLYNFKFQ